MIFFHYILLSLTEYNTFTACGKKVTKKLIYFKIKLKSIAFKDLLKFI